MNKSTILSDSYNTLLTQFGEPVNYWPQWCSNNKSIRDRELIIIGMILVQRTTWHNANIALKNLKKEDLLSINKIAELEQLDKLTQIIRPAGFFQSKPKRLLDICRFITDNGGVEKLLTLASPDLRTNLLNINGIGCETADTIMLYALDIPVFIIDQYTRRWLQKMGLDNIADYNELQEFFHANLVPNTRLYQNLHALIIISQNEKAKAIMELI